MPKYYNFMVQGYYLYFTSHCIVEAFHVHASDKKLTEAGSAKFFVHKDGTSIIQNKGRISDKKLALIQEFIKDNYKEMFKTWKEGGGTPEYYKKKNK